MASAGVSTPARLRPVSHSTTTDSGRPEAAAACGSPAITVELSAATVMLALACSAASRAIFSSPMQVVADQDVVDPGLRHHLGLAEFLAGDAASAGRDLHPGEQRALVGLDVRAIGDTGCLASPLNPRDVALHLVHVDDGYGRAVFAGDFGGEGSGHILCLFNFFT